MKRIKKLGPVLLLLAFVFTSLTGCINEQSSKEDEREQRSLEVEITSPENGEVLSGEVEISAETLEGVTVTFYIDNEIVQISDSHSHIWNTSHFPNGHHKVSVEVTDGREMATDYIKVFVLNLENQAPEISLSEEDEGVTLLSGVATLTFLVRDLEKDQLTIYLKMDQDDWSVAESKWEEERWQYILDTHNLKDGWHTLSVKASDGEKESEVYQYRFEVDNTAPDLNLASVPDVLSNVATVTVEAEDSNHVRFFAFFLDHQLLKNGTSKTIELNTVKYGDGMHTLTVGVTDIVKNYAEKSKEILFDNQAPDIYFKNLADGTLLSQPYTVEAGWHDLSGVEKFIFYLGTRAEPVQEGASSSWYFDPLYWLEEGEIAEGEPFFLKVVGEDRAGNTADYTIQLRVDLTPPSLEITSPTEGDVVSGVVPVKLKAEDRESSIFSFTYSLDGEKLTETTSPIYLWNTSTMEDGEHEIEVTAVDEAGNKVSVSLNVVVDNTMPDVVLLTPEEGSLLSGDVEIQFSASDETGLSFVECFVDGAHLQEMKGEGNKSLQEKFYLNTKHYRDGEHHIKILATDLAGNSKEMRVCVGFDNTPPKIGSHRPWDGQKIKGEKELYFEAEDDNGIREYRFFFDKELIYKGSENRWTLDTTKYQEGKHTITFEAVDQAGNKANLSVEVTVDNINPLVVNFVKPHNQHVVNNRFKISVEVEDDEGEVEYISFYIDNRSVKNSTEDFYLWDTKGETTGWHEIRVLCGDDKGNTAEESVEVFVDNVLPEVDITNPEEGSILKGEVKLECEAEDGESGVEAVVFYIDHKEVQNSTALSFNWNTSGYTEGTHEIRVVVFDKAWNREEESIEVKVDNTPPIIEIVSPEKEYLRAVVRIKVNVTENGSGINYIDFKIKGESRQNSTKDFYRWDTRSEEDGPGYEIEVVVRDKAGNENSTVRVVMVDNTPPEIGFINPKDGEAISGIYLVEAEVSDKGSGRDYTRFYLDDDLMKNSTATTFNWNTSGYQDGWYTLRVEAFDKAGNLGSKEIDVEVDNTLPEIKITSHSEGEKLEGEETFVAEASDTGSGIWQVEFYFGGNLVGEDKSEPYTATINANDYPDGDYQLLVIARDRARNFAQETITLHIGEEAQPIVPNPHTNLLTPYPGIEGKERLLFSDYRAVPVVTPLIKNFGVTPSVNWDGHENQKPSAQISFTSYARFSGRIALNYWSDNKPEKSIVVEDYAHALLMAPYASIKNYPIFIYEKQYTDEAIWKMETVYANQIIACGNTGYNNKGVTVVEEDEVVEFTLNAAKSEGLTLNYLCVANPNDGPSLSNTAYLSSFAAAFASIHNGALILVHANTNEINTKIKEAANLFEEKGMSLKHIAIVGDHISVPMVYNSGTPSDNKYADFDDNIYTIEKSIGRIFALELKDMSYYFDRVFNYQDYWNLSPIPPGPRAMAELMPFWNDNAVIYMGVAAEFAEDSENHCREYMRLIGQFNTKDATPEAHGAGGGPAIMEYFSMSNYIIINADHGMPSGTVTWNCHDLPELHPAITFAVSCSLGRVDGQNKENTVTYKILEKGINAYMAPTRTAYGSFVQTYPYQPIAAPGLCYLYLRFILDNDYDSGEAYMHAKNDLINNGYGGNVDKITTWQYQHYGDPAFNPYEPNHEGWF